MPQSLAQAILHLVFSTSHREKLIDSDIRPHLHAYLAVIGREFDSNVYRVGGTNDHVHIAITLPRTTTVAELVQTLKTKSSHWVKQQGNQYHDFHWQRGYGAFSVSPSQLDTLIHYIDNQEEHHRQLSFKEEYLMFLEKYRIDYDEQYIWE